MIPGYFETIQADVKVLYNETAKGIQTKKIDFSNPDIQAAAGRCFASIVMAYGFIGALKTAVNLSNLSTTSAIVKMALNVTIYLFGCDLFQIVSNNYQSVVGKKIDEIKAEAANIVEKGFAGLKNWATSKNANEAPLKYDPIFNGTYFRPAYQAIADYRGKK